MTVPTQRQRGLSGLILAAVKRRRTAAIRAERVPVTDDELWQYVKDRVGVTIPRKCVCAGRGHVAPFTAFADAFFARHPIAVWKASRGYGGKSLMLALLAHVEAILLRAGVSVLGGSGKQSENVNAYIGGTDQALPNTFWNHPAAPRGLLASDPTMRKVRLTNGGYVHALAASQRSVRGPHPQRLRLDEIDEMDIAIFDAAMGQPMQQPGKDVAIQVVASSTHQYPDKTMQIVLARAKEHGWPIYEWCYRESMEPYGWLTEKEVATKRTVMTSLTWETEVELQEPSPEGRVFDGDCLKVMYRKSLGTADGAANEEVVFEKAVKGARYVTANDLAKTTDWTISKTWRIDIKPASLVAWARWGRMSWPAIAHVIDDRHKRYPGANIYDGAGVGSVLGDYLETHAEAFTGWQGKPFVQFMSEYVLAVEHGEIEEPMVVYDYDEHRLATREMVYGSKHLPDSIATGAMGWKIIRQARGADIKSARGKHRAARKRLRQRMGD